MVRGGDEVSRENNSLAPPFDKHNLMPLCRAICDAHGDARNNFFFAVQESDHIAVCQRSVIVLEELGLEALIWIDGFVPAFFLDYVFGFGKYWNRRACSI